ncbi:MAG TPA: DUF2779 domain-containing protein [Spirochaetia bacterium]|nr:DUF2779 domain-containing protein [Spirochaetia bacterium]
MTDRVISKTTYIQGLQCPKLLWHRYNAPNAFPPLDEGTRAIMDQGHEVGHIAQRLFPGGIAVEDGIPREEVVARSRELLGRRLPLFEAGFRHGDLYARADVLEPVGGDAWDIVEVKSASRVSDPYWDDLAVQRFCYEGAGLSIRRCAILHVNTSYVRRGRVDPAGLLTRVDVTATVDRKLAGIQGRLRRMAKVIQAGHAPKVDIGPQCSSPYRCPLVPVCWKGVLDAPRSIFSLARLGSRAWKLYRDGVRSTDRIPADFRLTRAQQVQVEAERTGRVHVNVRSVKRFLAALRYPVHYLDFETFASAVPPLDGTRPYQQVPFQFSLDISRAEGSVLQHHSWVWDGRGDPAALMLERLRRSIGPEGAVVAYGAAFERQRLKECAESRPDDAPWVAGVLRRLVDLLSPFRQFAVYHPAQEGSASMKRVLPALAGTGYDHLAIREGGQASMEFRRVTFGEVSPDERRRVIAQLEEYCGLDTAGMDRIVSALRRLVS